MAGSPAKRKRRERFETWSSHPAAIDELCTAIGNGASLTEWSRINDLPFSTVRQWIADDALRASNYARAREERGDHMFDQLEKLVDAPLPKVEGRIDPGAVQHRRLQVETKKWIAAKLNRNYDDSLSVYERRDPPVDKRENLYDLSNAELRDMILREEGLSSDTELTNEVLLNIIAKHERRVLSIFSQLADERGLKGTEQHRAIDLHSTAMHQLDGPACRDAGRVK